MSSVKTVSLATGPKFVGEVPLKAQYVWVLLASYDNTGNSETQTLDITRTVTTNLNRTTYTENIQKTSQESSASISLNATVPIVSDVLSIGGEESAKWASSFWQQYTNQLTTNESVNTTTTFQWTFRVGPNAKLDMYRLNFVGPAGLVETDTTAIVPTGTPMKIDNLIIVTRVSQQYSYWSTDREGGTGGNAFDDGYGRGLITKLSFRAAKFIDSVKAVYANGNVMSHGGDGGADWQDVVVDLKDPVASIAVRAGKYVDHVTVQLRSGKTYPFGGDGGHSPVLYMVPAGFHLISLFGRSAKYLDAIQFVFTNQPPQQLK